MFYIGIAGAAIVLTAAICCITTLALMGVEFWRKVKAKKHLKNH